MHEQPFASFEQHGPLTLITEGMTVYDRDNERIGTVKRVYMGNTSASAAERGQAPATAGRRPDGDDSLVDVLTAVFAPNKPLPEALRGRLLRQGFVAIDATGLFADDRYATPDQIAAVRDDSVILAVPRDRLIAG